MAQRGCGGLSAGQLFQRILCTDHCGCEQHSHGQHQACRSVPGGDTLISSRSLTMTEKRNRVFTILDSILRQRFTDMRNVVSLAYCPPFIQMDGPGVQSTIFFFCCIAELAIKPCRSSRSKLRGAAFSPQKEKVVVVVYSDEVLQGSASVLLRLSLPPHDAEGAIYVRRRLRLPYLNTPVGHLPPVEM